MRRAGGKPGKGGNMKKRKLLTVNLSAENYAKLKALSEKIMKPMTVIIRELLEKYMKEN
jgi:predicted DNA-binding protein